MPYSTKQIWQTMHQRCYTPSASGFERYGGKGILVCDRWHSYENFFEDMGERPPGTSIDRIDGSKNYSSENCRWATNAEQARNKRTNIWLEFNGERMVAADWAKRLGIHKSVLFMRLKRKWPLEEALTKRAGVARGKPYSRISRNALP